MLDLAGRSPGPDWLTISGGNPGLYDLSEVVKAWQRRPTPSGWDSRVAVETQGSRWQPWFRDINLLTVSPKGPSSGMKNSRLDEFMRYVGDAGDYWAYLRGRWRMVFKVVVFDEADYLFARDLHQTWPLIKFYLSCGTAMGGLSGDWKPPMYPGQDGLWYPGQDGLWYTDTEEQLLGRYRWLAERMMSDPVMADVAGFPQLHCLLFGITTRGV